MLKTFLYSILSIVILTSSLQAQIPTITSFTPMSGPIGTFVTITGTNFDTTPTNNIVYFGATQATVSAATTTELTATVPVGANYKSISVLVNGLVAFSPIPFIVTFDGGGSIDTGSFASKVDILTSSDPNSVAIGDLDGDGKADLAVLSSHSNTLSIHRNTSTGSGIISYAPKIDYSTPFNPWTVSIGDLDGDGKTELIVANNWSTSIISVYRNTSSGVGNISFTSKVDFSVGSNPSDLSIGDLDGDGKTDIAVANQGSNSVSVLRNTSLGLGNVSFATKVDYTTGSSPYSIAIGDINGDQKADLIVANLQSDNVSIFRNLSAATGIISYATKVDLPTGILPYSVAIGDIDGDGKADLAVANNQGHTVSILRNTNTSVEEVSFTIKEDYPAGTNPNSISIGDLDGDGMLDLAVTNYVGSALSVLRNISSGPGVVDFATKVNFTTEQWPTSVTMGDLDGNGKIDIAVANDGSNTISILKNDIGASSSSDITAFGFPEQTGAATIDATNHTIAIEVTTAANVTALISTFTLSSGASTKISTTAQVSGTTTNNFTNSVTYTVTAEDDSTTQDWVVIVTIAPNTAPTFTSTAITTIDAGNTYTYSLTTDDADGDNITVSAPTKPNWLSLVTANNVTTLAGSGSIGSTDANGTSASLKYPFGIAVDVSGNVYVADHLNHKIRKIAPNGDVITLAGSGSIGSIDANGISASFNEPTEVAVDASGNVYVADAGNHKIRKIAPNGDVTTLAGSGNQGNVDTNGSSASFNQPIAVAVDASGIVYVVDHLGHKIRKIAPNGDVTTLAGSGNQGSVDANGTSASFNFPDGIAVDASGIVYVGSGNKICRIAPNGDVTTFAGSEIGGSTDANGTSASFHAPRAVAVDASGNVYVADYLRHKIRKINPNGDVTTLAGSGSVGSTDANGTSASFKNPAGIDVDASGNLYVADRGNHKIRKITVINKQLIGNSLDNVGSHPVVLEANDGNGGITQQSYSLVVSPVFSTVTSSVTNSITANSATLNGEVTSVGDATITERGFVYSLTATDATPTIAESSGSDVTKVVVTGTIGIFSETLTGLTASTGYSFAAFANNSVGTTEGSVLTFTTLNTAPIFTSTAIITIDLGNTYSYTMTTNDADGDDVSITAPTKPSWLSLAANSGANVTTLAGSGTQGSTDTNGAAASFYHPRGVAVDALGNLYVADYNNHKIRKIAPNGDVTTLAGSGSQGSADGNGTSASFYLPYGVAIDASGNVYVADAGNHKIRKIASNGDVTTLAGSGSTGSVDGNGAAASFNDPRGVAVDASGTVFVADESNNKIRKIAPNGDVTTLAGSGSVGFADGNGANASFHVPIGIAVDGLGNVYVADVQNHKIRKIAANGDVTTLAGSGNRGSVDSNGTSADFNYPYGVAVDASGNVYVADQLNNKIRKIAPNGDVTTLAGSGDVGSIDGNAVSSSFGSPTGVAVDASGNVYVGDLNNQKIRKISASSFLLEGDATGNLGSYPVVLEANDGNGGVTQQSFTVLVSPVLPTVTSSVANAITLNSATLNGEITSDGGATITERGFVYSLTASDATPTVAESSGSYVTKVVVTGTTGVFSETFASLTASTGYSFTAYAINSVGTTEGSVLNLTTTDLTIPTVTSFTPMNGPIGTTVIITGTNFDSTPTNNIVYFGATQATVSVATATELTITIPVGATYMPITILVGDLITYSSAPFKVTFESTDIDVNSFTDKVDYTTELGPTSVAVGDLNGDGKIDLVVANYNNASVSVFRNISTNGGSIDYASKVDYATGSSPKDISIGDLDGDGKLDLAVANYGAGTISIFRNTSLSSGTISFANKVDIITGLQPASVSISDLDSDGKADLAVANHGSNTVSIFRNTRSGSGTISYANKIDFTTGLQPQSVSIGDLDGDGKSDLAVANLTNVSLSILRNTSTLGFINFETKVDYTTGTSPIEISIGDLDGDGKADLAVVSYGSTIVSVFRNTSTSGTISYADKVDYTTGSVPLSVSIGDLDGDDKADLAVVNFGGNSISVFKNTSTGAGNITYAAKVDYTAGSFPHSGAIGDFDGNGKPDLVVVNYGSGGSGSTISILGHATNSDTDITAFSLAKQTGTATIDPVNHTIDIEVAFGTDLTDLISTFTLSTGATAKVGATNQISITTANDFTNSVTYTITAEDGSTAQDWAITVSIAPLTVSDNDGNTYSTVQIGTQIWMAENLKTTNFKDNSLIPLVTDNSTWAALTTPAYCWYNNDEATYKEDYGALYNWYAIQTGNICPTGWHIPSNEEWTVLSDYLGGESVAGGKLKEAGTDHWLTPNQNADNSTGFTGLPGGVRSDFGNFGDIRRQGFWYSSTYHENSSLTWYTHFLLPNLKTNTYYKHGGFNARCLMDVSSSETEITAFSFSEQTGVATIDNINHTVDIEVVFGTDITTLIPTFSLSSGATAKTGATDQVSGTSINDFTNPLTYSITAEEGTTTQDWVVTVSIAPNSVPTFTSTPITTIDTGNTYNYNITTNDTNGDNVIITALSKPSWLNLITSSPSDVTTLAGSGTQGSTDTNGAAASFYHPRGVAVDALGNLYVADYNNHKIRKIAPNGDVTTLAGSGSQGSADGNGTSASFYLPYGVAIDASGNVYVADAGNHKIRKIASNGDVTTLAGSGSTGSVDGNGAAASFNDPRGVAVDASGTVFVTDESNNKIRKIAPNGDVTTLAGSGSVGFADGNGANASFHVPIGIAVDGLGNVYVADVQNHKIRKIAANGDVTTLAGSGNRGSVDSNGTSADFNYPYGVAVDASGNVYVADQLNNKIRKIAPNGDVTTLAGSGDVGSIDGNAVSSSFGSPTGVAVDASGNVYVGDLNNQKIRKISASSFLLEGDATGNLGSHPVVLEANDGNGGVTQQSFTVLVSPVLPTVTSSVANAITLNSATLNGEVTSDGGATITERGFVYSSTVTDATPTIAESSGSDVTKVVVSGTNGAFSETFAGFTASTSYSFAAYATNSVGTTEGSIETFITVSNNETDITTFSFSEQTGAATINDVNHTVAIEVAFGTNVTSLVSTFILSSDATAKIGSIDQVSGTIAYDFTSPVTYTVTAEDGTTTQDWVVTVTIDDGLVAYYPFNGNANDESGNGHHGTVNGSALSNDRFGNSDKAYVFDGVNDFIEVSHSSSLVPSNITISAWINIEDFGVQDAFSVPGIVSKHTDALPSSWVLYSWSQVEHIRAFVSSNGSNITPFNGSTTLQLGQWYHVVFTYNGSVQSIYMDGTLETSNTSISGDIWTGSSEPMWIGATFGSFPEDNFFHGQIDDIRIYDRELSSTEISTLYNSEKLKSTETDFTAFSYSNQVNTPNINTANHTIEVTVSTGTSLTALIPTFTLSSGASVKIGSTNQVSGTTTNDYTSPVTYTVTAEDGTTTQDWVVTVIIIPNTAPTFTSTPITTIDAGLPYSYTIATNDIDEDYLNLTTPTKPNWLSLVTQSTGVVTTLAGSGSQGSTDAIGTSSSFSSPRGIAVDVFGNVYVADMVNNKIRKITPQGDVTTLAGSGSSGSTDAKGVSASFSFPTGVAVDALGNVYVADNANNKIRKIAPDGTVTTLAGSGSAGSMDDNGTSASFNSPNGIAIDASGNVYVAEYWNHKIRKIAPDGEVTTLAGSGSEGSTDANGTNASFSFPYGVVVDASDNVFVADAGNNKIRKITPDGNVTTLAGSGSSGSTNDNGASASFSSASGVAVDASGNVYVADRYNNKIRKITPEGDVTTLAGSGSTGSTDANGTSASFYTPAGVAVDASGNVYVADASNHEIRKIAGNITLKGNTTGNAGSHPVVLVANDGNGGITQQNFTVVVNTALPTVTSSVASSITTNSATLNGEVSSDGGASITERGFVYSLTAVDATPTLAESSGSDVTKVVFSGITGVFNETLTSLTASASYSFAAYAINSVGTTEGSVLTFTTLNTAPVATPATETTLEDTQLTGKLTGTDIEGSTLTFAIATQSTNGTLDLSASTGDYTYAPVDNYTGSDAFSFTVNDGDFTSATADVSLTITAVNDTPVATPATATTLEDIQLSSTLTGSDIEGTTLTFAIVTQPTNGTLDVTASTGDYTYAPAENYAGSDTFSFTVNDGDLTSSTADVILTISAVNDAPVATPSTETTLEDTQLSGNLTGTDIEGTTLTFAITTQPTNGTLDLTTLTGAYTYTPNENYSGSDSFTFTVSDGELTSALVNVEISITPVNDVPIATPTTATTLEDTQLSGTLTGTDIEGSILNFAIATQPTKGTLDLTASTGTYTYTPNENYSGSDSFTFTVNDGDLTSNIADVSLTITAVNDPPLATPVTETTLEDTQLSGTLTGTDIEESTLTFAIETQPTNGTLELTTSTGAYTYMPTDNYSGSDAFNFTVNDGDLTSTAADVSLTITAVNDTPLATSSTATTLEDTQLSGTLTGTDIEGSTLTFAVAIQPTNGTLELTTSTGAYTYMPTDNYSRSDAFSFTVNDGDLTSTAADVSLTITAVNDMPLATSSTATTLEDTQLSGTLTGSDIEGSTLTFAIAIQPTNGTLELTVSSGDYTYTPTENYSGSDVFSFTTNDGELTSTPASIGITVTSINDAPTNIYFNGSNDSQIIITERLLISELNIELTGEDDSPDELIFSLVEGNGDQDNGNFQIVGNVITNTILLEDILKSYFIRVSVSDGEFAIEEEFEVFVNIKTDGSITFNLPDFLYTNQSPFGLNTTSEPNLPIEYEVVSGNAEVIDGALIFNDPTTVVIRAFHLGNDIVNPVTTQGTVTILGIYEFLGSVTKPDNNFLNKGTAKLHGSDNQGTYTTKVADGVFNFGEVKEGDYVLHIIPNGTESQDVSHTYYDQQQFSQDANVISVLGKIDINVSMLAKRNNGNGNNGNGKIRGKVVSNSEGGRSRIVVGQMLAGEGLSNIPIYLLDFITNDIYATALTDSTGFFQLDNIETGEYIFRIDVVGIDLENTSTVINFNEEDILEVSAEISGDGIVFENIILSTEETLLKSQYIIYPNPSKGLLNIQGDNIHEIKSVSLFDISGKLVYTINKNIKKDISFKIDHLSIGIYQVIIKTEKTQYNYQLILEK